MSQELRFRSLLAWAHLYFLLTFRWWLPTAEVFTSEGLARCLSLPVWYLERLPRFGYHAVRWGFDGLVALSVLGCVLAYRKSTFRYSWYLLAPLLLAKVYLYALDLRQFTTFHHMHLLMVILLMVSRRRLLGLRLGLALIYLVSGLGKLNPSWTHGEYFCSLGDGLPLLGANPTVLTLAAWAVILLELIGPWLWFSPERNVRLLSLALFSLFHIYSGIIVGFSYTALMLPLLYLLLWPSERAIHRDSPVSSQDVPSGIVLTVAALLASLHLVIPSDVRLTAEGRYFSFSNMFDANRSVVFEAKFKKEGVDYLLRVARPYAKDGFYDAQSVVMLSRDKQPLQHLSGDLTWKEQVVLSPRIFQQTHVRIIGDPYLYLYASERIMKVMKPESLSISLRSGLDGRREHQTIFELNRFDENPVRFQPWGGNSWLSHE